MENIVENPSLMKLYSFPKHCDEIIQASGGELLSIVEIFEDHRLAFQPC